jgi:2-aminoethylphosphonate-pyruvate transaminase
VIVTIHQPADPRFDLMGFVEALKRRGVLISNFYNTAAPTMRIGAIGAISTEDIRRAVGAIGAALDEVLAKAA